MTTLVLNHSPLYVALLMLMVVGLAARVSMIRAQKDIWMGDGGDKELQIAGRRHGNALEHAVVLSLLAIVLDATHKPGVLLDLKDVNWRFAGEIALWAALASRVVHATSAFKNQKLHAASAGITYLAEMVLCVVVLVIYFFY